MRLRTVLIYLFLLPLAACTRSCDGDDYDNATEFNNVQLPAYTETGANTLGCRLGSQVWTVLGASERGNYGYPWRENQLEVAFSYSQPYQVVATGQMTGVLDSKEFYNTRVSLNFHLPDTLGGVQLIGDSGQLAGLGRPADGALDVTNLLTLKRYLSSSRRPMRLLVRKHHPGLAIVSGTFEGYIYNQDDPQDSLAVTDGRFDLKYK